MDPKLSELRLVEWQLEGADGPNQEWVLAGEVEELCAAIRALHLDPGINPHSGRPTARLQRLSVASGRLEEGFWWTSRTLDEQDSPARVVRWRHQVRFEAVDEDEADPPDPV